ncbi:UNKNOWN [Stylonychia lemnae]|uniref:Transmembrane protein n=1 Tax=Stylonychia lemnae TaxID=5949 RepID=A0A078AQ19_STYLE|nr:UNKNOWN [Stylonychia lemnae]|eukprot:CDW84460.1 UNKNOWN [Stylonychia lemnae]
MKQEDVYFNICYYGATFFFFSLFALIVLMKLDFKVDRSAKVVIFAFMLSLGAKVGGWFIFFFTNDESQEVNGWFDIFDMNTMQLIVLTIYYFIFEMNSVYIKFIREHPAKNKRRLLMNKRIKVIFLSVSIILQLILDILIYPKLVDPDYQDDSDSPKTVVVWIIKIVQLIQDIMMLSLFIYLYIFFTSQRMLAYKAERKGIGCYNKIWIMWICFLILIEILNLILRDIISPLMLYNGNASQDQSDFLKFYARYRFIWFSLADFIVGSTIVYMFYKQGMLSKKIQESLIQEELKMLFYEQQNKSHLNQYSWKSKMETGGRKESSLSDFQLMPKVEIYDLNDRAESAVSVDKYSAFLTNNSYRDIFEETQFKYFLMTQFTGKTQTQSLLLQKNQIVFFSHDRNKRGPMSIASDQF